MAGKYYPAMSQNPFKPSKHQGFKARQCEIAKSQSRKFEGRK